MPLGDILAPLPIKARLLIEGLVRLSTYTHAPTEIDAKAALDQLRLSFSGTIYVDVGWQTIVDGLAVAAKELGVDIRTSERVVRFANLDGRRRVEFRHGRTEEYIAAVVTLAPQAAAKVVADSSQLAAAASRTRPIRVMALDLALSDQLAAGADFVLGFDEPTYLSVHSAAASLAPEGRAVLHLARYLAPDERPSPDYFSDLEQFADMLHPSWREIIVHEQRLSGATVAHDFPRWTNAARGWQESWRTPPASS